MCGLFGILNLGQDCVNLVQAGRALDLIRHRGPDDEGWLLFNTRSGIHQACAGPDTLPGLGLPPLAQADGAAFDLCLGHRRLSILDVGEAGHQPMANADRTLWVIFNGEIYNYVELRSELQAKGHLFHTRTDTEVLLAAYQEWGPSAVERFIGMFAFCLVDLIQRRLVFARDHFGIKPLYIAHTPSAILFASEVRALLAYPGVERRVHPQALYNYLRFGMVDGAEQTLFRGIQEFPGGSLAILPFGERSLQMQKYWDIDPGTVGKLGTQEAVNRTRTLLDQSVRMHLRSDVPLGTCLSGGLDSTAILMLMKNALGDDIPIETFSFITDDPVLSEQRFVNIACEAARVNVHSVQPTPGEFASDLQELVRCQEFPFAGPTVYAQHRVFRLARENGMKVMLDGQGADELFGGYYSFIGAKITSLLSSGAPLRAMPVLKGVPGNMSSNFPRMLAFSFGRMLPESLRPFFRALVGEPLFPRWLNRGWFRDHGAQAIERPAGQGRNALKEEMAIAVTKGSLSELLRYEDRNSMWFSIESRVPFCNPRLAEMAFSLAPDNLISPLGVTKAVLKTAMRGLVPDQIIDREKVGFGTPERDWLSALQPFVDSTLKEGEAMDLPYLSNFRQEVLAAINSHGRWPPHAWRIINLIIWNRDFGVTHD